MIAIPLLDIKVMRSKLHGVWNVPRSLGYMFMHDIDYCPNNYLMVAAFDRFVLLVDQFDNTILNVKWGVYESVGIYLDGSISGQSGEGQGVILFDNHNPCWYTLKEEVEDRWEYVERYLYLLKAGFYLKALIYPPGNLLGTRVAPMLELVGPLERITHEIQSHLSNHPSK